MHAERNCAVHSDSPPDTIACPAQLRVRHAEFGYLNLCCPGATGPDAPGEGYRPDEPTGLGTSGRKQTVCPNCVSSANCSRPTERHSLSPWRSFRFQGVPSRTVSGCRDSVLELNNYSYSDDCHSDETMVVRR